MVTYRTLDGTFGALSHPTRRQIMLRLREGDASVSELAAPHTVSLPAISKHVRVLEDAGLLLRRKEGREQRCSLATSPLQEVESWLRRFGESTEATTNERKEKQHG